MVSPRSVSLLSLGALPAMVYYAATTDFVVSIAVLNVVIIALSLYFLFSPLPDDHEQTTHA